MQVRVERGSQLSTPQRVWVGVDAGKAHHWAVAVDHEGHRVLSRKVANDEAAILELIGAAGELAAELRWAVDIPAGLRLCCWRCCWGTSSVWSISLAVR